MPASQVLRQKKPSFAVFMTVPWSYKAALHVPDQLYCYCTSANLACDVSEYTTTCNSTSGYAPRSCWQAFMLHSAGKAAKPQDILTCVGTNAADNAKTYAHLPRNSHFSVLACVRATLAHACMPGIHEGAAPFFCVVCAHAQHRYKLHPHSAHGANRGPHNGAKLA